jgi:hypothetical protein
MKHTKDGNTWLTIRANAGYWFAPDTLKFFGSRIYWQTLTETKDGYLFISSEDNFDRTEKRFSVRSVNSDYDIDTLGEYQGYATLDHAKTALKNIKGFADFIEKVGA